MRSSDHAVLLAMTAVALLLLAHPASALSLISPANASVVANQVVLVQYTTASTACQALFNDVTIELPGCGNFTMNARTGENTVRVWDGIEARETRFWYGTPAPTTTSSTAAISAEYRTSITPIGLTIRGRTAYQIPVATVSSPTGSREQVSDLRTKTGTHQVEIEPIGSRIRRVTFEGVPLPQTMDLGLEDIPVGVMGTDDLSLDAFAIDPSRITFTNGTITKTAVGNRVWKCAQWDFDNRTCNGDWELVAVVSPGQAYDLAFNATDPAYVETFDDSAAVDVDIIALDNTTIVIGFVDAGTNHTSFEIWNTNGALLVDETDVDTTGNLESRISLDTINSTHFTIIVSDGPEDDLDFYIYDRNGNQVQSQTQVDPNIGLNTDVDACQLGDRFAVVNANDGDNDADFEIWSNAGTSLVTETAVDINIAPGALGQNLVSCSALNTTHWGYAFFDDADNDVSLSVHRETGAAVVVADLDNNVGETGQVASAGLRNDRVAVAFYDSTDDDITMTVRTTTGTSMTTVLVNTDIDTDAGTDSRVAAAEIENDGASEFVVVWQDTSAGDIKAAVYDVDGAQVTAPFTITTTESTTDLLLGVTGYNSLIGTGLCNATFAVVYTNDTGTAVFETYWRNGTRWDGVCGAPDNDAPIISLIDPPDNTINITSNTIDFFFNVTDASDVTNCTLYIDDVAHTDLLNPARDTTINITAQIENGEYNWSIGCFDVSGNSNITETRNITIDVPLIIVGAETRMAALDNITLVIAFIDGTQNDASFEIWHTNGTRLLSVVDVDTSVDTTSRIAVDPINTTHFIIGVLDGPEDDFDFYIYDRDGNPIVGQTQIDPNAGANNDIDICQLDQEFAAPWIDSADGDANYEIWDNTGTLVATEAAVDISTTPSATLQNLAACSALNTTHWGYAFFDDADNDASLAIGTETGGIAVTSVDLDTNVGETGQVASAGLRNDRIAVAFYDSTDDDITLTIRGFSGSAMSTILANTDIDTDAGIDSRVAATGLENNGASEFVVAWQDTSDTTIKAAVYDVDGTQVTAPFTITSAPNATNLLIDLVGYHSHLGIGICNGTFAIAYNNASGNTVFETYWRNGTRWDGVCGEVPQIDALAATDPIVLNAGSTKSVVCNITAFDLDGASDLVVANATFFHESSAQDAIDDPSTHYTNASCASVGSFGNQHNYTCAFELQYFALNGTWNCTGMVQDVNALAVFSTVNVTVDPLYALNVTETLLLFGDLETGQVSANISENITNVGNMRINISVRGYGGVIDDGNAFNCANDNITVSALRFAPNITAEYATKEVLATLYKSLRLSIPRQDAFGDPPQNVSYWQLQVPADISSTGDCNGTIVFQADAG